MTEEPDGEPRPPQPWGMDDPLTPKQLKLRNWVNWWNSIIGAVEVVYLIRRYGIYESNPEFVAAWLNRTGLLLQFLALFLVTPEILGEKRVRAISEVWTKPLSSLRDNPKKYELALTWFVGISATVVGIYAWFKLLPHAFFNNPLLHYPTIVLLVVLVAPFVIGSQRLSEAMVRQRSFFPVGAVLFSIGFVLLTWATFVRAKA